MPKNQFVDPNEIRKKGKITFHEIEVNQYSKTFSESCRDYEKKELIDIYHDMQLIREFETMLYSVRTSKSYKGVEYSYIGPAHLYLGQEAAAVGMAFTLELDDIIFGSHRSHGEVLAKGMSAIRKISDDDLYKIMKEFNGGTILQNVEGLNKTGNIKNLAEDFLLYGFIAELFGRENGFTKGLGNSMHVFFTPFGIYPNNAIVGGSAGISVGAALYKKINLKNGIVVCNIGDGSMGRGPVWEALNFASQDQFEKLWPEPYNKQLPIIFNFLNNSYGMGGQTCGETMGFDKLARVGAGLHPNQLFAERIDGYNPFAVIDAFQRKKELIKNGEGPILLDTITYRIGGHSTTDANSYRTMEEIEAWKQADSIEAFKNGLIDTNISTESETASINEEISNRIIKIMKLAIDDSITPRINLDRDPDGLRKYMFSNGRITKMDDREPEALTAKEDNAKYQRIKQKSRYGLDENGKPISVLKAFTIRDALFEAILEKFYEDPTLIAFGEDNRCWGGAFGVYSGMDESIPYHRLFNSPISESAIVAVSVGYGLSGGRALPELMYCDFLGCAGDEIFNQLSKWQSMSAGNLKMPVVLRVSCGTKYGAQHAQDWSSLCAHIPGLKVCYPVTPYDAKGLMNAALSGTDPVVFFESQKLYDKGELFHKDGVPNEYYEIQFGEPDIKKSGNDLTVLSFGASLYAAVEAAEILEKEHGISVEVIDARCLVPFNYEPVINSVKKTGRIILISEACERGSQITDMARNITEFAFDYLDAPPVVVAAPNVISPCPEMEKYYYPQANWILDAFHEKIFPLKGYVPEMNFTTLEKIRRERMGF